MLRGDKAHELGLPLTTEGSLRIYDLLCRFTGASGAIRQAEFFVYRPSDRAALEGDVDTRVVLQQILALQRANPVERGGLFRDR